MMWVRHRSGSKKGQKHIRIVNTKLLPNEEAAADKPAEKTTFAYISEMREIKIMGKTYKVEIRKEQEIPVVSLAIFDWIWLG